MKLSQQDTVAVIRQALLFILVLGNVGVAAELLLLKHTDGFWQLIPFALIGMTLLVTAWYGLSRSRSSLRTLRVILVFCFVSGGVGVVQHFRGNLVYAAESNPSISGRELYLEAIMGSTPALAPGTMVLLALIGLAFVFRHPVFRGETRESNTSFPRTES